MFPELHYVVSLPEPETHYFYVRWHIEGELPDHLTICLPVWTPGSYLIREFSRHLVGLTAESSLGRVTVSQKDKACWDLAMAPGIGRLSISYRVYAYELSVRTSHLDDSHGYFNGATLFVYHPEWKPAPATLEIQAPEGWQVATALEPVAHKNRPVFFAPDYDTLIDCPVEIGQFKRYSMTLQGVPHDLVIWGEGPVPAERLTQDIPRLVQSASEIFGSALPYSRYLFILHLTDQGGGGLEHRNSATIAFPRDRLLTADGYERLLALFAHEFFHLWNVKRLRPENLGPFDYQHEVYTPLLWALEGITDYYAYQLLSRSGLVPVTRVLDHWAESLKLLDNIPGADVQSLTQASFDTWIKFYRPDANTPNITVSYYLKGAVAALYLDLELRRATNGRKSLDDVFLLLWNRYGERGYPSHAWDAAIIEVGGPQFGPWLKRHIQGTAPFDETLWATVGLTVRRDFSRPDRRPVDLGIIVGSEHDRFLARHVLDHSPAWRAGIAPGDEILAIDNLRVNDLTWNDRLAGYHPGDSLRLTLFRRDVLREAVVTADPPRPDKWSLGPTVPVADEARVRFQEWSGAPYPF